MALDFNGFSVFGNVTLSGQTLNWPVYPGAQLYEFEIKPTTGLTVDLKVTPGAAGAAPRFEIPDLSQVAGWKPSWTVKLDTNPQGWAMASNASLDRMLAQDALGRYEAGYRGWVAASAPPAELGAGPSISIFSAYRTCITNCAGQTVDYACESACDELVH